MVDVNKVEKLMELMEKHGFDVVQTESKGEKFSLARNINHANFFQNQSAHPISHNPPSVTSAATHQHGSTANHSHSHAAHNHLGNHSAEAASTPAATANSAPQKPAGDVVTSPFVGTFYRSQNPETPPFVEVGTKVKKGQALCIVEAMKLMNEIEAEVAGEIVAILIENAKPVEFGTPLFVIKPN